MQSKQEAGREFLADNTNKSLTSLFSFVIKAVLISR